MARKFSDEDKEEVQRSNKIKFGVTPVQITLADADVTPNGADFIEVSVVDDEGREDNARLYFTDKSTKYSIQTIRDIAVHNADTDDGKEKRRNAVNAVSDMDELVELINTKMSGFNCWFTRYYDETRTYQGQDGKTYRSVNTAIVGYEAKEKPELMPKQNRDQDSVNPSDYPDDDIVGQGEQTSLEVPFDSPSDAKGSASKSVPDSWDE